MRVILRRILPVLLLCALPVPVFAACSKVEPNWLWNYEGTIGNATRIRMTLVFGQPSVTGVYFYAKYLQDIRLRGRILDGSKLVLEELNSSGEVTARFDGSFPTRDPKGRYGDSELSCEVFTGTWRNAKGGDGLPFYLAMDGGTSGSLAHRYAAVGTRDDEVVHRNARRFWEAVARNDAAAVASTIRYPIKVTVSGKVVTLRGPKDLTANYAAIFTPAYRESIARALPRNMFVRDQGIMLGSGQVWFGNDGRVIGLN